MLGLVAFGILGGGYYFREQSKQAALREQIQQAYDQQLGQVVDRYRGFRTKIEGWVTEAGEAGEPERYVDPRLRIAALHSGQGLYLRLTGEQAQTPEGVAEGALAMDQDAITRCLGISPISIRGFYEKGEFLMPGWIDRAEEADGMMRLRVIDDELARYSDRDLPAILNAMQSQYFLLVIDREGRGQGPVDVYLYDLRGNRRLLAVRTEPEGILIPVRVNIEGAPPSPRITPRIDSPGAAECSIAAQVKELTGEPAMDFRSDIPREEDAGAPRDAGASDEDEARDAGAPGAPG